jgi:hypothetical protein
MGIGFRELFHKEVATKTTVQIGGTGPLPTPPFSTCQGPCYIILYTCDSVRLLGPGPKQEIALVNLASNSLYYRWAVTIGCYTDVAILQV